VFCKPLLGLDSCETEKSSYLRLCEGFLAVSVDGKGLEGVPRQITMGGQGLCDPAIPPISAAGAVICQAPRY
jgi:hypothetical protein